MSSKGDGTSTPKDQSSPVDSSATASSIEAPKNVDPELDAILDSALADFDKAKDVPQKPAGATAGPGGGGAGAAIGGAGAEPGQDSQARSPLNPMDGPPEDASYDFLAEAMSKQFEDTFSALMNDPNLKKQFEELASSADQAASTNNTEAFAETVEKALSGLNLNAENIQGDPNQQELWEQLAETLGGEGGMGGGAGMEEGLGAMSGMFQNMVKQLLSKELLYQPLKEVSEKYKVYLDEKQHDLEPEKVETYRKQLEIIEKVVEHLDGDSDDHSMEEKNARFEVLLDLLQRMHELGNPPQEVVGEGNMMMPNLPDLGAMGQLPNFGAMGGDQDPSQCTVM